MLTFSKQCNLHSLPNDIICKDKNTCIIVCLNCFNQNSKSQSNTSAVRLNTHAMTIFTTFSSYVETKMGQWINSVQRCGSDSVFQKCSHKVNFSILKEDWQKMKNTALNVIQDYRKLVKANREYVVSTGSFEIIYHHQFLKDIYNMILEGWEVCAQVILNNFVQKMSETFQNTLPYQYKIRQAFIYQINCYKEKLVNENAAYVIISTQANNLIMNQVPSPLQNKNETKNVLNMKDPFFNLQQHAQQIDSSIFDEPLLIKRVDSQIQIRQRGDSNKSIQFDINNPNKQMKKSKIIDQDDYHEWQAKFLSNLHQIQQLKKENDHLKKQNSIITNEKISLQEENQNLKKRSQPLPSEIKPKIMSQLNQQQNRDPRSYLHVRIASLQAELNDNSHDMTILTGCINDILKQGSIDRELLYKKLSILKTPQFQKL